MWVEVLKKEAAQKEAETQQEASSGVSSQKQQLAPCTDNRMEVSYKGGSTC